MIEIVGSDRCTGCGACHDVCPKKCIEMKMDREGFRQPVVNKDLCVNCNMCDNVCPVLKKKEVETNIPGKAYATWNKDRGVLMDSSSGGAFTAIATNVIKNGGIVFGAVYGDNFKVKHIGTDKIEDLNRLRRAKYMQSDTRNIFNQVKQALKDYNQVVFVGSPCQVDGMVRFLGGKPENLVLIEFICHGVPSRRVFEECNKNFEKKFKSKIVNYEFHSKRRSWRSNTVHIDLKNGKSRELASLDNPFMRGFFQDIILRKSCYDCQLKKKNRVSDMIIADFWEINKVAPELNRKDGVSMVLTLTENGDRVFNETKDSMEIHEVDCGKVLEVKRHIEPCKYSTAKREAFMKEWLDKGYDSAEKKYLKPPVLKKYLRKIKEKLMGKK